ncbi:hypothetical protein LSTR_LSTR015646 [Laodelphax striatellus]|uniref:Uncharacterized protein n=1 Tax=Laodelphax striatellus TaxID=195883 RepID=A0A482XC01_LAOST|nr:hypothetical protein LSTR_LSTR015646 [Laodelphax striatellus]
MQVEGVVTSGETKEEMERLCCRGHEEKGADMKKSGERMGYNATEELKIICLTTLNASLREFLIKNMDDILNDEAEENYMFLSLVLDVMIRYDSSPNAEEEIPKKLCLTISSVKALSQDKKSMILTELFFKTWDIVLLDKLNSTTCWQYLIENNRLDLLKLWIGHESPPVSHSDWPQQWPITQPMVDWVFEADCLDSTRRVVLDWLANDGIISTNCKENAQTVLQQLGRVKLLGKYEQVLDAELHRTLLQFASDRNMIDLVVNLTKEMPDVYSKYIQDNERTDKQWLQLWKAFMKVDDNWEQDTILELVQKTADFIASNDKMEAYLQSHPSVALAIAILQNKSLVEIENAQSISPLLAVGVQSEDELNCKKQTSLYDLLSATTAFQTDNLFQWQRKRISHQESGESAIFPHFGCSELSSKFGHKQTVQYVDYLQNGRPSFAFLQFFQENSRAQGKIPLRMQKRGANVAHGLALRSAVVCGGGGTSAATCVAFVEMLSRTSLPLRVHWPLSLPYETVTRTITAGSRS